MANHEFLRGQNPELAIGQKHGLVIEQIHRIGLGQRHDLDLKHADHDLGLSQSHHQDLGLGHPHDGRLILGHLHHTHDQDQYVDQDQSSSDLALLQNHEANPHSIITHNNELVLSDNHELSSVENHNISVDPNLEQLSVDRSHELSLQLVHGMPAPNLMVAPVLQSRIIGSPNHEFHVGQEFPDVKSCRRALRDMAIACHFEIQTVKSDKNRFTAKCAAEGCPWRIHAAKLPGVPTFTIRTCNENHTCSGLRHLGHQQASAQWVASSVEDLLRDNPQYKPKEILEEIHRVHGITLSYKQAWRGKERIMTTVCGSFEEGYRLLPQYCEQVKITNPGSVAFVCGSPDDKSFKRLFISYYASICGFVHACLPLIALDKILLKSKYIGTLLLATGFDGDGAILPLAFGVVDEESDDNWIWFLSKLHALLEDNTENMPRLTILSDRQKGIVDGVDYNFPTAFHGFCMRHLSGSLSKEFPHNANLINLFWEASHALTILDFEAKILEIEQVSQEAAYWIQKIPPRLWATAYFEGTRFGHLTANIAESLTWLSEASGLPIMKMMEFIRQQLMSCFNDRREISLQWTSILVPSAEQRVSQAVERACDYQVGRANEAEFEVVSPHDGTNIVDIRNRCCLCRGWQLYGVPCVHGVAALLYCRQNVHRYTESCFTVATYRKTYLQTIHPIPDKSLWKELPGGHQGTHLLTMDPVSDESLWKELSDGSHDQPEVIIKPPKSLMPPRRPHKRKVRSENHCPVKRVVHCSRCNQTGHFRTTCVAPI